MITARSQRPRLPSRLLVVGALLLGLGYGFAALPTPPESEYSTLEAQVAAMHRQAEESLQEQIAVGKQRHEQRIQFRQTLIEDRQAQAAARQEQIHAYRSPVPAIPPAKTEKSGRYLAWMGALCCAAIIGWQFVQRRNGSPVG